MVFADSMLFSGFDISLFFFFLFQAMSAGVVGLSLVYAKVLTGSFQWCVRQSAEVESLVCAKKSSLFNLSLYRHLGQIAQTNSKSTLFKA